MLGGTSTDATERIIALERDYLLPTYSRNPLVLSHGRDCYLYDLNGNEYLDLISGIGVNALGYAHPRITRVLTDQASRLIHSSNLFSHEFQGPLAQRLAEISGLSRTFFSNSGTEAIEGAIKIMRAHGNKTGPEKFEIVALENSFHGRTMGALALTGQPKYRRDFEPLIPGVRFVPQNDVAALERAFSARTAGIVFECIQGEAGIRETSHLFIQRARELADQFDALVVYDETQCGVGRLGTHFAYQALAPVPVLPDVITAAKPLACGVPLGVIVCNERAASCIRRGMHGSTFGGGPLACRIALEFLDILDEILPSIEAVGKYFKSELVALQKKHAFITEVRARGLMIGLQLDSPCEPLVRDALASGLLINCTQGSVLRLLPPYIVTEREVDLAIGKLDGIFSAFGAKHHSAQSA